MKTYGAHNYFVYILTNKSKSVLYVGVTNNLRNRLYFHRTTKSNGSFTSRYNCFYLIYWERFSEIDHAILREKEIKGWKRVKKEALINEVNPKWEFLNGEVD